MGAFPVLIVLSIPVLAVAGLSCLIWGKGKNRRRLAWAAGIFLCTAVLWLGGNFVMSHYWALCWRSLPSGLMCSTLMISGWTGIFLILETVLSVEWPKTAPVLRWAVKGTVLFFAVLFVSVTVFFWTSGGSFVFCENDWVVKYEGQTLLVVSDGCPDSCYGYYEYHGPLVRGTERLYDDYEPLAHN